MSILAKPKLSKGSFGTLLTASQGESRASILWAIPGELPPLKLDPTKNYRFDLIEQRVPADVPNERHPYQWEGDFVRIADGDHLIHDFTVCRVHHTQMHRRTVQTGFGDFSYSLAWAEAKLRLFPNAKPQMAGGGLNQSEGRVFQCDACLAARNAWCKTHGED